ncbi:MAG: ABC transporter permease [Bacteroidetes bacterium]|nr:ABC transporter permease [Bacteroidota bacterium]MDA1121290.1 ABC transporter permease [Bacteroidota bacterium]
MKVFLAFVKKEFYHIFRDKRTLLVLFGMPFAQLILFGYAITTEVSNASIAVYNQSPGQFSEQLIDKLVSSDFFTVSNRIASQSEILETFRQNKAKLVIIIPPDFENKFSRNEAEIQLIADGSDPNLATILGSSANRIIQSWMNELLKSKGANLSMNTIIPEVRWHYNPELKSVAMFVPGVVTIILMLVSAMLTSISITREKELGTIEILYVSPLKPVLIIIGKVVPFAMLSILNAIFILVMAYVIFNVPVNGSIALLLMESMLFILTALSLGVFISTVAASQQTALMLSLFALMLPTILLSGFIFPISNMPWPLQIISNIIPAKWFLIIIKTIMLKGLGIVYIWKETLILLGMTLGLIALSIRKFKIRLQ